MITGTCPFCGSADWDCEEKMAIGYEEDGCWIEWACYCHNCNNDFRRLEDYKLTKARHEAFEEG